MKKSLIAIISLLFSILLSLSACVNNGIKPSSPEYTASDITPEQSTANIIETVYDEAQALFEDGLYLQAYYKFAEVDYSDAHYEEAVLKKESAKEKYISAIADKAAMAKTEPEIVDAITLINSALEIFPGDETLNASKTECDKTLNVIKLNKAEEAARKQYGSDLEYISSDVKALNWVSAIEKIVSRANSFLDSYKSYAPDLKFDSDLNKVTSSNSVVIADLLNHYFDKIGELYDIEYKKQALRDSENEFEKNKDYAAAIRVLNTYIAKADDISDLVERVSPGMYWGIDDDIWEKLGYYRQFIPVLLSDVDRYGSNGINDFEGDSSVGRIWSEDINGVVHDSAQTLFSYSYHEKPYISFYLNGKYDTLSLTLFCPRACLPISGLKYQPYFRIYGDDILLYEAPRIDKEHNSPFDVSVNVTGVRVLKVEMKGLYEGENSKTGQMIDSVPCIAATEWILKKDVP